MPRVARTVIPGVPHHVTQRGNRKLPTFFHEMDYREYLRLLSEFARREGVEIWAYCLMPNHVHLIAVPQFEAALRNLLSEVHKRYTKRVNFREGWRGHLWQGRFASFPMDETYLLNAARYIELNPVRGRLSSSPESWPWSSARAHLFQNNDSVVNTQALLSRVDDWRTFLSGSLPENVCERIDLHSRTGRPLGSEEFVTGLERRLGHPLAPKKRGPKPKLDRAFGAS